MYGTAYQLTRNHARAQELTQDALVLAWRGINSFQGGSLKAWLVKILTNRGISLGRRREIDAATLDDPDSPINVADETQDPAAAAISTLERERIQGAMSTLPEEQRQVVALRFFSELSVSETAAAFGSTRGDGEVTTLAGLEPAPGCACGRVLLGKLVGAFVKETHLG